jgi:hypothetical protein
MNKDETPELIAGFIQAIFFIALMIGLIYFVANMPD